MRFMYNVITSTRTRDVADSSQFWLLGYEFPATLLVFTPEVMYVVTTAKKGIVSRAP